jgi:hypothetical protein
MTRGFCRLTRHQESKPVTAATLRATSVRSCADRSARAMTRSSRRAGAFLESRWSEARRVRIELFRTVTDDLRERLRLPLPSTAEQGDGAVGARRYSRA